MTTAEAAGEAGAEDEAVGAPLLPPDGDTAAREAGGGHPLHTSSPGTDTQGAAPPITLTGTTQGPESVLLRPDQPGVRPGRRREEREDLQETCTEVRLEEVRPEAGTVLPETIQDMIPQETTQDMILLETTQDMILQETTQDMILPETTPEIVGSRHPHA